MPGRSCQTTCLQWWAPLDLEGGGDRRGSAQPRGAYVADWRAGHRVGSLGNASHTKAYGGGRPGAVLYRVGRARAAGRLARVCHEYHDFAHF